VLVCSTNNLRRRVCVTATNAQLSRSWYFNSVCAAADHAHRKILANMLSLQIKQQSKINNCEKEYRKLIIAKKNNCQTE
jgi:predicted deacetylase